MRISDWSSDGFSSDLQARLICLSLRRGLAHDLLMLRGQRVEPGRVHREEAEVPDVLGEADALGRLVPLGRRKGRRLAFRSIRDPGFDRCVYLRERDWCRPGPESLGRPVGNARIRHAQALNLQSLTRAE